MALIENELRFVLLTSKAVVSLDSAPATAMNTEVAGLSVLVEASDATKCGRCWHHIEDVGSVAEHPELCGRCVTNVSGEGEVRHYA